MATDRNGNVIEKRRRGLIIDGFWIDAAITEEHELSAEITSYPVETGADVTDHVRTLPKALTIEGLVSDTPLGRAAVAREGVLALIEAGLIDATTPANDAFEKLLAIFDAKQPITVETDLRVYKSMMIESLSVPRDAKTGDALAFTATFREIVLVENKRTRVRVATPPVSGKRRLGPKASDPFLGPTVARCLEDRAVFVRPQDREAALVTNNSTSDIVWSNWKALPTSEYSEAVTLCIRKERVGFDNRANGGHGAFTKADGKTPLSQEEVDTMNAELRDEAAQLDTDHVDPTAPRWRAVDGRPLVDGPSGTFIDPDTGRAAAPFWHY